jgi:hypothetical protein
VPCAVRGHVASTQHCMLYRATLWTGFTVSSVHAACSKHQWPSCIAATLQGEAALQFQAQQGALTLEQEINQIGPNHNFTKLVSFCCCRNLTQSDSRA